MMIENEGVIRALTFIFLLAVLALAEWLRPGQVLRFNKIIRWRNNFLLLGVYTILLRLVFPLALIGFALYWQRFDWGLLVRVSPLWLHVLVAVILLDAIIYWQHRLMHHWSWLWHIHRIHHSDADLDVSTAVRFHPLEIFISIMVKIFAVVLLGAQPVAVMLFELLLSGFALFNHSNIWFPQKIDKVLRIFFVTPNMHCIHHSQDWQEHNRNFGFALSCWDRLFSSYTKSAKRTGNRFAVGLPQWQKKGFSFSSGEKINKLLTMKLDE